MAYDESLAERVRQTFPRRTSTTARKSTAEKKSISKRKSIAEKKSTSVTKTIVEKKMFGGLAFFLNGNVAVGVWKDSLIVRLGPEQGESALHEPYVKDFDITGRPLKGWAMVGPEALEDDDQLKEWIHRAMKFVKNLPRK
jgi:TfoX/Sxy family transcriptional regulator of competence genes